MPSVLWVLDDEQMIPYGWLGERQCCVVLAVRGATLWGLTRVLEAIRQVDTSIKLYQASSGATSYTVRPIAPRSCSPRRQARRPPASDATRNTSSMAVTDLSGVSGSA